MDETVNMWDNDEGIARRWKQYIGKPCEGEKLPVNTIDEKTAVDANNLGKLIFEFPRLFASTGRV